MEAGTSLREALADLPTRSDRAALDATHWHLGPGLLHVRLPNFAWRKRALASHDAHHVLTGFPCTPAGEMQMAAWEFAAGRYPHAGATAFCLPLVGMGALLLPRRTFNAFLRGRRSTSLYSLALDDALLASPVDALRARHAPDVAHAASMRDRFAYLLWVGASLALMLVPFALLAFVFFWR